MSKYCLKKPSKRLASAKRFKIEKKVREHNRRLKKQAKKNALKKRKGHEKPINIPNKCPFKEEMLLEAEEARKVIEREKKLKQAAKKKRTNSLQPGVKRKAELEPDDLSNLTSDAQKRVEAFAEKNRAEGTEEVKCTPKDGKMMRAYASEVRKTIEMADVIIEVLDARDPLGSRCEAIEKSVLDAGKRVVFVLNKIDLVPKENVKSWLAYLRTQMPTIAFKASTQEQNQKLGTVIGTALPEGGSKCFGAELLMKLLANYCRNKNIKTSIRVGVIGYPNVGKSSIINSLKRKRACNVGALSGITRRVQEVELDKHIRLIDSPGIVLAVKNRLDATEVALKNAIRIENIEDPVAPVQAILRRCRHETLMMHYMVSEFGSCEEFLALVARKLGRLKKGARPDLRAAARHVLNDWNSGKLRYFTQPPENSKQVDVGSAQFCSSQLLNVFSKEFDLDALDDEQKVLVEGLPSGSAMDMDLLYQRDVPLKSEEDETNMDIDDDTTSQQRSVVVDPTKKSKKTGVSQKVEQVLPKSLKITGNVQLNRCIKKVLKRQRKRNKKIARKADALAESMDMAAIEDKQESFNF